MNDDRVAVGVSEAARLLGISRGMLYLHLDNGEIPSFRLGNRRLFAVDALREWANKKSKEAEAL